MVSFFRLDDILLVENFVHDAGVACARLFSPVQIAVHDAGLVCAK